MELGLALDIEELALWKSQMLGESVTETLFDNPRLPPRDRRP
jgi:hypothetical protein